MPHDIDSWETISCSLTGGSELINNEFVTSVIYDDEGSFIVLEFGDDAEVECNGFVQNDVITITELSAYGDWSGSTFRDSIVPFLELTKGRFEAVLVWDGETIEHLLVIDGEVTSNEYTAGELIKRINELTAILEL